jgi:serine/threonine protein kinase
MKRALPDEDVTDLHHFSSFAERRIAKKIGGGTYSNVYLESRPDLGQVAVKRMVTCDFDTCLREIASLRILKNADNVITLKGVEVGSFPRSVLMELATADMTRTPYQLLKQIPMMCGIRDLVQGLSYIHAYDMIHCDFLPENILVTLTTLGNNMIRPVLKITDFGVMRRILLNPKGTNTAPEICTALQVRAPEVITKSETITQALDIWALGITLCYWIGRQKNKVFLYPYGIEYSGAATLKCIVESIGHPHQLYLKHHLNNPLYRKLFSNLKDDPTMSEIGTLRISPFIFDGLIRPMLKWMPEERPSIQDILFTVIREREREGVGNWYEETDNRSSILPRSKVDLPVPTKDNIQLEIEDFQNKRVLVIEWMLEIAIDYDYTSQWLLRSIHTFDHVLHLKTVIVKELQPLSCVCMILAEKLYTNKYYSDKSMCEHWALMMESPDLSQDIHRLCWLVMDLLGNDTVFEYSLLHTVLDKGWREENEEEKKKREEKSNGGEKKTEEKSNGDEKKIEEKSNGDEKKIEEKSNGDEKKIEEKSNGDEKKIEEKSNGDDEVASKNKGRNNIVLRYVLGHCPAERIKPERLEKIKDNIDQLSG